MLPRESYHFVEIALTNSGTFRKVGWNENDHSEIFDWVYFSSIEKVSLTLQQWFLTILENYPI